MADQQVVLLRRGAMMKVRLRVLHGKLQDKEGHGRGTDVKIPGPRFVIGSAEDCAMCCKSTSVRPHHCEIFVGQQEASVRSLSKEASTLINGQPVEHEQVLHHGDVLRIGRLEFEVLIEVLASAADSAEGPQHETQQEEQELSDMLAEADAKERAFRLQHPELRELHLEPATPKTTGPEEEDEEDSQGGKKKGKKFKKLPRKLPVPPVEQSEDSTEAAEEALRRMFRP
jgi:predicted component of type VI protein secretion system